MSFMAEHHALGRWPGLCSDPADGQGPTGSRPCRSPKPSFGASFLIGPALAYTFMYIAWTGTLVGEIGGVSQFKNSFKMFMGGNIFSMIVCAGFLWLLISRISNEFFTSSNFLWMSGNTGDMPVAPYYGVFLMALSRNPWVWLWIAIGLSAWFWIWPTNNIVMSTRVMFAMSYDRMLPGLVARDFARWGAPVVAISISMWVPSIMGWLYFFTRFSKLTLDMPLMTSIAFATSTLVGTAVPVSEINARRSMPTRRSQSTNWRRAADHGDGCAGRCLLCDHVLPVHHRSSLWDQ